MTGMTPLRRIAGLTMASAMLAGGVAPAAAQDVQYSALAKYLGELPFDPTINDVVVNCYVADGSFGARCQPAGTVKVTIGAAARHRLGLTTGLLAQGTLVGYTATSTTARLKIAPATKRKLKAAFKKAQASCHNCSTPLPVNARMSVTLTGPVGMPLETISDTVQVGVGSGHGGNKNAWAWTSNYHGWKPGGSGADSR
jgi:hypothetical protein